MGLVSGMIREAVEFSHRHQTQAGEQKRSRADVSSDQQAPLQPVRSTGILQREPSIPWAGTIAGLIAVTSVASTVVMLFTWPMVLPIPAAKKAHKQLLTRRSAPPLATG
jgi:hypothetical protein